MDDQESVTQSDDQVTKPDVQESTEKDIPVQSETALLQETIQKLQVKIEALEKNASIDLRVQNSLENENQELHEKNIRLQFELEQLRTQPPQQQYKSEVEIFHRDLKGNEDYKPCAKALAEKLNAGYEPANITVEHSDDGKVCYYTATLIRRTPKSAAPSTTVVRVPIQNLVARQQPASILSSWPLGMVRFIPTNVIIADVG